MISCVGSFLLLILSLGSCNEKVRLYPAPEGADLSDAYSVKVEGRPVAVYQVKVAPEDKTRRWLAMSDKPNSGDYYEVAAMAYFDMNAPVRVTVEVGTAVHSAKILPTSAGVVPQIQGNGISFTLNEPCKLNIEINGEWVKSLHLFANPFETDVPDPNDPDVIWFGPGIHEIEPMTVGSNKTVYIAGGAIVRGVTNGKYYHGGVPGYPGECCHVGVFMFDGDHIRLRGRGIFDGGKLGMPPRRLRLFWERGSDIVLQDVIVLDPPAWTMPVWDSQNVRFDNLKIIGFRANSDGIDIYNSTDVTVNNCYIRSLDDLVVIKAFLKDTRRVTVENCVFFNQLAHPFEIGSELYGAAVSDIVWRNCDVIHDQGREWTFRIMNSGDSEVSNVTYENIRVEECAPNNRLISLGLNFGHDGYHPPSYASPEYGKIRNVLFKDITVKSDQPLQVILDGHDVVHTIDGVTFRNVRINGQPLTRQGVQSNEFVYNLKFE
jgi:hypothetical protein